jgi:hypothetical protein
MPDAYLNGIVYLLGRSKKTQKAVKSDFLQGTKLRKIPMKRLRRLFCLLFAQKIKTFQNNGSFSSSAFSTATATIHLIQF